VGVQRGRRRREWMGKSGGEKGAPGGGRWGSKTRRTSDSKIGAMSGKEPLIEAKERGGCGHLGMKGWRGR